MIAAITDPWWFQTTLRVVGGLAAVLLVAGTLVYLHPVSYTHLTLPTKRIV